MKTNIILDASGIYAFVSKIPFPSFRKGLLTLPLLLVIAATNVDAQPPVPNYPALTFNSPTLISGSDLQVNAVYNFPNVTTGVDAHVTIMDIAGGAWLAEIDNTTGAGYFDAFQPYVGAGAGDTSYIDWKFVFKKAGTNEDTILPVLAVTGVDVDGDASALKEFIQAATPGSFALDASTYLNFSFDGIRSSATSTVDNYPNIDTANTRSMFQMNFTNINTILYRNGAITTAGSQVRQTSIYFKSFFNFMTLLPVRILAFEAKPQGIATNITWTATEEDGVGHYMVQKSTNCKTWKNVGRVLPGSIDKENSYQLTDLEENNQTTYYRLQQTTINGKATYSKTVMLKVQEKLSSVMKVSANGHVLKLRFTLSSNEDCRAEIYTMNGVKVMQSHSKFYRGNNQYDLELPQATGKGIYLIVLKGKTGQVIHNQKVPVL